MRVDLAKTNPALYRSILAVAVWQVLFALNYWFAHPPTFTPYDVPKNAVGAVFFAVGVAQLVCLNVVRDLRAIRLALAVSIFFVCSWGLLNTEQGFRGKASFALPLTLLAVAAWQVLSMITSPVNFMARKATT